MSLDKTVTKLHDIFGRVQEIPRPELEEELKRKVMTYPITTEGFKGTIGDAVDQGRIDKNSLYGMVSYYVDKGIDGAGYLKDKFFQALDITQKVGKGPLAPVIKAASVGEVPFYVLGQMGYDLVDMLGLVKGNYGHGIEAIKRFNQRVLADYADIGDRWLPLGGLGDRIRQDFTVDEIADGLARPVTYLARHMVNGSPREVVQTMGREASLVRDNLATYASRISDGYFADQMAGAYT